MPALPISNGAAGGIGMSDANSVDPREMAHYERLAELWWDPTGPFWPLHGLNQFRVGYLVKQLQRHFSLGETAQPLTGLRMLDIGCGGGILSESMAKLGAQVTGLDPVARNIAIAEDHAAAGGLKIDYRCETIETHAMPAAGYDVVLNMEVVEHVEGVTDFLTHCAGAVAPGGMMFVATINRTWLAGFTAIFGAEYVLRWLPKGTHQYRKLRRPAEVSEPLQSAGLALVDQTGVAVSPLTRRFRYTRNMAVNYMMAYERPTQGAICA